MKSYLELLSDVYQNGKIRGNRTTSRAWSTFGRSLRINLSEGFPLLTTKAVHLKSIVHELLWFIKGDSNIKYLNDNGVHIWDEWADENGNLGNVYGVQWRKWKHNYGFDIDQLGSVIDSITLDPNSRRHIVSAWNISDLPGMALPPCHMLYQFYVAEDKLSISVTQRSADMFLGLPFNIASYALLTHMVADVCRLGVGELIWNGGDCHVYENHKEQVEEQLSRTPTELPTLVLQHRDCIDDFIYDDIKIINYNPAPCIKAPIAV